MGKVGVSFKSRLRSGDKLFGTPITLHDFSITEIIGNHGYDYVWIDLEHSAMEYQILNQHILAAQSKGMAAIVCVPVVAPFLINRVLEMGPDGIVFSMTRTRQLVQDAIDGCLYPPLGKRGYGPNRAADYGLRPLQDYLENLDDELCKFIQIDARETLDNIDDILAVHFLDGLVIEPMNLSFTMGYPGEIYSAMAKKIYDCIAKKAARACLPAGVSVGSNDLAQIKFWNDCGIRFIAAGGDDSFLNQGASSLLATLRNTFDNSGMSVSLKAK